MKLVTALGALLILTVGANAALAEQIQSPTPAPDTAATEKDDKNANPQQKEEEKSPQPTEAPEQSK